MDPNRPKTDSHIAQQCRRDRLRTSYYFEESLANLDQATIFPGPNPDILQFHYFRNGHLLLDQAAFSSETINLTRQSNSVVGVGDSVGIRTADDFFENLSYRAATSEKASRMSLPGYSFVPQSAAQNLNWVIYDSARMTSNDSNDGRLLGVDLSSSHTKLSCIYESGNNFRNDDSKYHCGQSSLTNLSSEISSQDSPNCHGDSNFPSASKLAMVSSAANRDEGLNVISLAQDKTEDTRSKAWSEVAGNELTLLPAYSESCLNAPMHFDSDVWYDKPSNSNHTAIGGAVMAEIKSGELRNTSLTLSSIPSFKMGMSTDVNMVEHSSSNGTMSVRAIQEVMGISTVCPCNSGPLGPFTGYASILKSSKFLKPAQQLLDEICGVPDLPMIQAGNVMDSSSKEVNFRADATIDRATLQLEAKSNTSDAGLSSYSSSSLQPEHQQMKAKLLYMQEEVCKRYRQYHQQMHMVFSSFQTVAGLNAATPYISLARKTIVRNFDFLKDAILYQLRHIKKSLGEDLMFPSSGPGSNKGDIRPSKIKSTNQSYQKNKYSGVNEGLFVVQHVLRPQRGLPERAVAILRAWLFEHFLHPYPTDSDKHILARQTGLSRNQVSNWFINARVRVWKPMVEEIHALDTKSQAESSRNHAVEGQNTALDTDASFRDINQVSDVSRVRSMASHCLEDCRIGPTQSIGAGLNHEQQWYQVIQHGVNSQFTSTSPMDFGPILHGGVDCKEPGSTVLALGLRKNGEFRQHQQQLL